MSSFTEEIFASSVKIKKNTHSRIHANLAAGVMTCKFLAALVFQTREEAWFATWNPRTVNIIWKTFSISGWRDGWATLQSRKSERSSCRARLILDCWRWGIAPWARTSDKSLRKQRRAHGGLPRLPLAYKTDEYPLMKSYFTLQHEDVLQKPAEELDNEGNAFAATHAKWSHALPPGPLRDPSLQAVPVV